MVAAAEVHETCCVGKRSATFDDLEQTRRPDRIYGLELFLLLECFPGTAQDLKCHPEIESSMRESRFEIDGLSIRFHRLLVLF